MTVKFDVFPEYKLSRMKLATHFLFLTDCSTVMLMLDEEDAFMILI